MDKNATGRLQWMTVVLVVFAVFSWGVQYKLSLYNWPARSTAAAPQAKLLSQKERPVAVPVGLVGNAPDRLKAISPYVCALVGWIAALALPGTLRRSIFTAKSEFVSKNSSQHLSYFFFRPPPSQRPRFS